MNKEAWEEKKRRNRELDRKSRRVYAVKPEFRAPGQVITMPSGSKYLITDKGWKRIP